MLNDDSKTAESTEENMTPNPGHGVLCLPHFIHHAELYQLTHNYCIHKNTIQQKEVHFRLSLVSVSYDLCGVCNLSFCIANMI